MYNNNKIIIIYFVRWLAKLQSSYFNNRLCFVSDSKLLVDGTDAGLFLNFFRFFEDVCILVCCAVCSLAEIGRKYV
jgi:hypothetical protein